MVLAVVAGIAATVLAAFALSWAADAMYAGFYADCPPQEWSQALLSESRVIAGVPSESDGYVGDCDSSGATDLVVADQADDAKCAAIVERAVARGWTVIHESAPCEIVLGRDLDGRTARLTLTSDEDATLGSLNLIGVWHRQS
jgi:hypothetical protein